MTIVAHVLIFRSAWTFNADKVIVFAADWTPATESFRQSTQTNKHPDVLLKLTRTPYRPRRCWGTWDGRAEIPQKKSRRRRSFGCIASTRRIKLFPSSAVLSGRWPKKWTPNGCDISAFSMKDMKADCDSNLVSPANEWDRYLETERPDIGYKQSSWWAEFQRSRGWESFSIVARDGDAICGGANVLVKMFVPGKYFYYIPHGPVLPEDQTGAAELFDDLMTHVDDRRQEKSQVVSHLRLEPRWLCCPEFVRGFRESKSWLEPRNTLCVDLIPCEDAILQQMKKKGRYNIRVAHKHGVSVVVDNSPEGFNDFMSLYKATANRQGIRRHSTDYFRKFTKTLFPHGHGDIFFAEYRGERLASALNVYFGNTATYKYGGSLDSHRNVMAPYLLQFEAMLKAKSRDCQWYDFYGVAPANEPDHAWANFGAFKRKFGGRELHFVPPLDYVYDSDAYYDYRVLKEFRGIDPRLATDGSQD